MRYGLPYKGSKNKIAEWIVSKLPPAETFVEESCPVIRYDIREAVARKYEKEGTNDNF